MEKSVSNRKWGWGLFLKWFGGGKRLCLIIGAVVVLAVIGIVVICCKGPSEVGYSVVDVLAALIAFVSLCVSVRLTLEVNKLAEQNRKEEERKNAREKLYAQMYSQAASFPQFKIDTCIVYDLDELLKIEDDKLQKVRDDVRRHKPDAQEKYLLLISGQEAFSAYYKIDIEKVHLKLLAGGNPFDIDIASEHCWVTNNERFTFWMNFDDQNDLVKELKEAVREWIPGERIYVEVKVEFSCANILLEWEKTPPLYYMNINCFAIGEALDVQVKLEVEHRYLSRMDT